MHRLRKRPLKLPPSGSAGVDGVDGVNGVNGVARGCPILLQDPYSWFHTRLELEHISDFQGLEHFRARDVDALSRLASPFPSTSWRRQHGDKKEIEKKWLVVVAVVVVGLGDDGNIRRIPVGSPEDVPKDLGRIARGSTATLNRINVNALARLCLSVCRSRFFAILGHFWPFLAILSHLKRFLRPVQIEKFKSKNMEEGGAGGTGGAGGAGARGAGAGPLKTKE